MNPNKSVTIVKAEGKFRVIQNYVNWCDFNSFDDATKFCGDMGYSIVPLNSKRGIRILNPTDPRAT